MLSVYEICCLGEDHFWVIGVNKDIEFTQTVVMTIYYSLWLSR